MDALRILFVHAGRVDENAGVGGATADLAAELRRLGNEVSVYCTHAFRNRYLLKFEPLWRHIEVFIICLTHRSNYDVIEFGSGDGWLPMTLLRRAAPPLLLTRAHGFDYRDRRLMTKSQPNAVKRCLSRALLRYKRWCDFRSFASSEAVICLNEYDRLEIAAFAGRDASEIHVVPNGVRRYAPISSAVRATAEVLCYVGRPTDDKGFSHFLKIAHEVCTHYPRTEVRLVGVGELDEPVLRSLRGATSLLEVVPSFRGVELANHVDQRCVVVLPSLAEGFGLLAFESVLCGARIFCYRATGTACWLEPVAPENFVDCGDHAALARVVLRAFANDSFGKVPTAYVSSFTWARAGRASVQLYRHLLGRKTTGERGKRGPRQEIAIGSTRVAPSHEREN
jgi:glycosyltransferase involved in cell wall biosynthesis